MHKTVLGDEIKTIVEISKEFGAQKVFLFGSCLEDIESANDIDIAVKGINHRDFFRYYSKITMSIDDEVDIVDLDDLREHLHNRIISKGKMIYEKKI